MASNSSIWPAPPVDVDPHIKQLITRFFDISNSTDPDSGRMFAEELFTEDGFFKTHATCVAQGRDAIAASRKNNSPLIASRAHQLSHVFVKDSPATDLVVLGSFQIGLKDGNTVEFDFTARFVVAKEASGQKPKLQFVQVWTDPTDMIAAFQRAKETLAARE